MGFWGFILWVFVFFHSVMISVIFYVTGFSEDTKDMPRKFWQIAGDRSPDQGFLESVRHLLFSVPLIFMLQLLGLLIVYVFFGNPRSPFFFDFLVLTAPFVFLGLLAESLFAPMILASFERRDHDFKRRVATARENIRMAFEFETQGRFKKGSMESLVAASYAEYLERASEIERSFRDTDSPIFDEEKCGNLARFARRHLKGLREIKANKDDRIVELLSAYHRYEWDVLQLAKAYEPPELEEEGQIEEEEISAKPKSEFRLQYMDKFSRRNTGEVQDVQTQVRKMRLLEKEEAARIDSTSSLTAEEKTEQHELLRKQIARKISDIKRRAGIV